MSNYSSQLQANNEALTSNNLDLQSLIDQANALPDAGGVELPGLANEGVAADLLANKELIDSNGEVVTGTFTIDNELNAQDDLISQIQAAVDSLPEAGGGDTVATAMITLNSPFSNYSVCYVGPSGAQKTTHNKSPFTCLVPSIMYINDGNGIIATSGGVAFLNKEGTARVLNITGEGTITIGTSSGSD